MPLQIDTGNAPGGFSMNPATEGEPVTCEMTGYYSSDDGNELVWRLEAMSHFLDPLLEQAGRDHTQVNNLLILIPPSGPSTAHCNELRMSARVKHRIAGRTPPGPGGPATVDDVADIDRLDLLNRDGKQISIPPDHGVVFLLSYRWRKGLFFDFRPCQKDGLHRTADLPRLFGQFFARLVFASTYTASDAQWDRLIEWKWFPFIGLSHQARVDTINLAAHDHAPDSFIEEMCREFALRIGGLLKSWESFELLKQHQAFFARAHERYEAKDYLSCLSILIPRVEGVIRTLFVEENPNEKNLKSPAMVGNLVENKQAQSLLLPSRFEQYLRKVYFRGFDQAAGDLKLSRNSHGHGVSKAEDYNFVAATTAFLTLDQIYYYLTD